MKKQVAAALCYLEDEGRKQKKGKFFCYREIDNFENMRRVLFLL